MCATQQQHVPHEFQAWEVLFMPCVFAIYVSDYLWLVAGNITWHNVVCAWEVNLISPLMSVILLAFSEK